MWTYRAKVIRVIDGDTVDVDIDLGLGIWQKNERVRRTSSRPPDFIKSSKIEIESSYSSFEYKSIDFSRSSV